MEFASTLAIDGCRYVRSLVSEADADQRPPLTGFLSHCRSRFMHILHVIGARPNLPKLAPIHRAAESRQIKQTIVDTGQHYDDALFGALLREFGLPAPDVSLAVGSHSHAIQTARIMMALEPVFERVLPEWVVVYGDVNSTLAAALVASKLHLPIAHVEAGVRSHDMRMPEEVNRVVTDRLADLLLTPSEEAVATLLSEGVPESRVRFVGNVMVDAVLQSRPRREGARQPRRGIGVTLHRPSNVDDPGRLRQIATALVELAERMPVVFPVHPRTRARLESLGLSLPGVELRGPIGYHDMLELTASSEAVITDSGGLQVEAMALGTPCVTLRDTTEWPETVDAGGNTLVPDPLQIRDAVELAVGWTSRRTPAGWDGQASERVVDALLAHRS
ncbi:MAG: UDP-N-acetylglucosamine 2-epimerase [Gemmatimonadetes bacterium]|nr:UDP-N-acetylglucosamine 2-epimerase [Gemmatimonadota bacterium]